MIKNIMLSAFSDEYSPNIDAQLDVLSKNGVKYFEPRFIGEKILVTLLLLRQKNLKRRLTALVLELVQSVLL